MSHQEACEFIEQSNGKIFSVIFTKRTTGEERHMVCRLGVKSPLLCTDHAGPAYDAKAKGLLVVYDMSKQDYRSIPLDAITKIKIHGEWQEVESLES